MTYKTEDEALNKVKIQILIQGTVFISAMVFNMKFSWDTKVETAGTDGEVIVINPIFFMKLPKEQRLFLILHEAFHTVFMHMIRRGNKDPQKYNQAADYVINILLKDSGYAMIPGGCIKNKYRNWSTEEVYADLPDCPKKYNCDIIYTDGEGENSKLIEQRIENKVLKAMTASKQEKDAPGTIPSEIERAMGNLIDPVLPWRNLLSRFMDSHAKEDYSYRRPNRRYLENDLYIPSLYSESLGEIHVAIDISASVTPEEFAVFLSEVIYIHEIMNYSTLKVITFDTQIQTRNTINSGDNILDIKFTDGGGTSLNWMGKYVKKETPKVLIIFSDMQVHIPKEKPTTEILWICVDNPSCTIPYGTLVHYPTGNKK